MKFDHQVVQELIQRSLQQPLTREERAIVSEHLAVCSDCVVYRYELSILEDRLPRALAAAYPAPRFSRAETAQVLYQHRSRTRRFNTYERFFSLARQAAFATLGVALVAVVAILAAQFGPRRQMPQSQMESPAAVSVQESAPLPAAAAPAEPQAGAYSSDIFAIQIQVPSDWQQVQQGQGSEEFSGEDGFVKLATLPIQATSLDQACATEASSQPERYGETPQINRVMVDDMQACLIISDEDVETEAVDSEPVFMANALVVEDTRREPEERFWVMSADTENFAMLASSLEILPAEEEVAAEEPTPEPIATSVMEPPQLSAAGVEVEMAVQVRLYGETVNLGDTECIKSELYIGEQVPEWWPRDLCASRLPDGKWEIVVRLDTLNPPAVIDPGQQNRFKVYWAGASEVSDWAYYPQAWDGLTLEEHWIVEAETDSPTAGGFEFKQRIPPEVFETHAALRDESQEQALVDLNLALAPFGYQFEASQETYRLLHNGELIKENILNFSPLSVNVSVTNFAVVIEDTRGYQLLQAGGLTDWNMEQHFYTTPVYVMDDLITLEQGENGWESANVVSSGELIFNQKLDFSVDNPIRALHSFNGQWVLETNTGIVIDGKDIRQQLAYDEVFHWQTLNDKPFYFFVKDGKVGLSYNGQTLPVQYDQVIHNQCCEPAVFNPGGSDRMLWFYALRDGSWHYVELGMFY